MIENGTYNLGPTIWGSSDDRFGPTNGPAGKCCGFIVESIRIVGVTQLDAGPCMVCDKPMARLSVVKHTDHNGYEYDMTHDYVAHRDGSAPCIDEHGFASTTYAKPRCPKCGAYGTTTYKAEAYGDRYTCPCGRDDWYSIGD
jgi:hypothetical protein